MQSKLANLKCSRQELKNWSDLHEQELRQLPSWALATRPMHIPCKQSMNGCKLGQQMGRQACNDCRMLGEQERM
jgi:hypothetical protein